MRTLIAAVASLLAACAAIPEQSAPREARIEYRTVQVPTPVPCFTEDELPAIPVPTPVDLEHATTDQIAAAIAADHAADELYRMAVEALFLKCQAKAASQPKGKPL